MSQTFGTNDVLLFTSLLYSCFDLTLEWDLFSTCCKPVHKWLLVSYLCVIALRVMHVLGSQTGATEGSEGGGASNEFLLDLRQKGAVPRALLAFTWVAALPFFAFLTLLGTGWLWTVVQETPQCIPSTTHLWFSGFWLLVCYLCLVVYAVLGSVALTLEFRVRRAEGALREIEDDDVRERWGQVSHISGYGVLAEAAAPQAGGLSPAAIKEIPCEIVSCLCKRKPCACIEPAPSSECSICLTDIDPGDTVRCLPGCDHRFHRSCIDLWLLRRADCPLCKRQVVSANTRTAPLTTDANRNIQWV